MMERFVHKADSSVTRLSFSGNRRLEIGWPMTDLLSLLTLREARRLVELLNQAIIM